ncbi:MAG: MBL fold metallo-hydrolase [Pseudomonadota bacterium]
MAPAGAGKIGAQMSDPFNKNPEATYGVVENVAPGVRRITCPNPSPYTFTGTQSYLVGTGDVAIIDPGPARAEHLATISAALGPEERISHILVTHSHADHSPGATVLSRETGAQIWAYGQHGAGMSATMAALVAQGAEIGGGEGGDTAFRPDHVLADGERVEGNDWGLTAINTPGHLSNHLSFALDGTGTVFTGDMIMGFATTLVSPPDGDMAAFMASLEVLAARTDDTLYLPGHGHPVDAPLEMVAYQRGHREQRFAQILDALGDGPKDAATLTQAIYTDIDPALMGAASRNVLASLIGLADQGRVAAQGAIAVDAIFERT